MSADEFWDTARNASNPGAAMEALSMLRSTRDGVGENELEEAGGFVLISEVLELPNIFQTRGGDFSSGYTEEHHVRDLGRAIQNNGDLRPITIWRCGGRWVLVDGHHRLDAYRRYRGPDKNEKRVKIPAVALKSATVTEALEAACIGNSEAKLPMTTEERQNLAWRLVRDFPGGNEGYSKSKIAKLTGVSPRSVAYMRSVKVEMAAMGKSPTEYQTWRRAMTWNKEYVDLGEEEREELYSKASQKLANDMLKKLGKGPLGNPEILRRALETYCGRLWPVMLVDSAEVLEWQIYDRNDMLITDYARAMDEANLQGTEGDDLVGEGSDDDF